MSEQNTLNGQAANSAELIKDGDTNSFMIDVMKASTNYPVVVDFWAPGSPACAELTSNLETLVRTANGAVKLVKINIQENQALASQFQIQSVPTVYAIVNGQPVDGFQGPLPLDELKKFIAKLTGEDKDLGPALAMAEEKLNNGDIKEAMEIYTSILHQDPQNPESLGGLIKCYISEGELEAARETLDMLDEELSSHNAIESARTALELKDQAGDIGELDEIKAALESAPDDHQKRFDLALAYAAKDQRAAAVEELITILKQDLTWNEGAARTQLITFFEAWGPKDTNTLEGRKRLASLLF